MFRASELDQLQQDIGFYDQLGAKDRYLGELLAMPAWGIIGAGLRTMGYERIFPATESGVRSTAVRQLARQWGMQTLEIEGNSREVSLRNYKQRHVVFDPIRYQETVAASKHMRIRKGSDPELLAKGVISDDRVQDRTLTIAFDTVVLVWNGTEYVVREKPESRQQAIEAICELVSGQQFVVSTVCVAHNLSHWDTLSGHSATLIPARIHTDGRFAKSELIGQLLYLYDLASAKRLSNWKLTPTGTVSLMHPEFQKHLQVGVGLNGIVDCILPENFSTFGFADSLKTPKEMSSMVYPTMRYRDLGDLALKRFVDRSVNSGGYTSLSQLKPDVRELVGMTICGYSHGGMQTALSRLAKVKEGDRSQAYGYKRSALLAEMMQ